MRGHIRKRGKTWSIVVDIGPDPSTGKRRQKWFSGYRTKKEAEKDLANIIARIENNTFIMPEKITVKEFLEYWLDSHAKPNLSPTTIAGYEMIIRKHLTPALGNLKLQKLRPVHIQQYYDSKINELSAKTLTQHHRVLRKALDYAFKLQMIPNNPADAVAPPKQKKYNAKVLTLEEAKTMLEAAKGTDMEAPINLALALGLRRGELLGLKWEDIDLENGFIHIKRNLVRANRKLILKEPKSETSIRTLKLSNTLIRILKDYRKKQLELKMLLRNEYQDNDLVFCRDDGQLLNPTTFSWRFKKFLEKNGLPQIRFHDLRHTNATLMLKSNIAPKKASSRLGHSTISITMDLYSHVTQDMEEEISDTLEDILYKD
mgnify:CR=1 FL=1